jgi:hypothetical protein
VVLIGHREVPWLAKEVEEEEERGGSLGSHRTADSTGADEHSCTEAEDETLAVGALKAASSDSEACSRLLLVEGEERDG